MVNVTSPIPCLVSINWYFEDRNDCVYDMLIAAQHITRIFHSFFISNQSSSTCKWACFKQIFINRQKRNFPTWKFYPSHWSSKPGEVGLFSGFIRDKFTVTHALLLASTDASLGWCLWGPPLGHMGADHSLPNSEENCNFTITELTATNTSDFLLVDLRGLSGSGQSAL